MSETMDAIVFNEPYNVTFEKVPRPTNPLPGEAIVRVKACGLCGSDIHPYRGHKKGVKPGTICGHEFAGVVEEVGEGVRLTPGQRVAASFTTACGNCWFCKNNLSCRCKSAQLFGWIDRTTGIGIHGGQAQFVRVPNSNGTLLPLPDELSYEDGVLIGDIFSTGYFCAKNALSGLSEQLESSPESLTVAVIGCGPVGFCTIIAAKMLGIGKVFAIDRVQSRLDKARELGAITIDPEDNAFDVISNATAETGFGADAVLEAVGNYGALDLCFKLVRPGGVVSSVGVHAHDNGFPVSPGQCYDKNITYRCGRCPARSMMGEICKKAKSCDIAKIISHRVPLSQGVEMYSKFESQEEGVLKVIFHPWDDQE